MVWGVNNEIVSPGKSGEVFPACGMNASCDAKVTFGNPICCINLPGKLLSLVTSVTIMMFVTVLQSDTGRQV